MVARITLLGADGLQHNYEAYLVGADRTKDLAVLKVRPSANPIDFVVSSENQYLMPIVCLSQPNSDARMSNGPQQRPCFFLIVSLLNRIFSERG